MMTLRRLAGSGRNRDKPKRKILDPLDPEFLKSGKPDAASQKPPKQGSLAEGSIIDEEYIAEKKSREERGSDGGSEDMPSSRVRRSRRFLGAALDPLPSNTERWKRKMVIKLARKRFKWNKTEIIKRREREHLARSHFMKTSIKKLFPLARQIAGKPIEEAIVQMRFSKKKAAAEVKKHLEYARDEAIVKRGMGLGEEDAEKREGKAEGKAKAQVVEDKDGIKRWVRDRTNMFVDQAWVGRGSYTKEPSFRARGRVDILRHPTTSISVLLKEEATRIRLAAEREEKRQNRRVWVPLPDRPVTAQRQYPLW
ncbi:MAG: hypothetical protein Q9191_003232 [Dirinaria sp. TL-2023a]